MCCYVKTEIWAGNTEVQTKTWCPIHAALKFYGKAFGHELALSIFKNVGVGDGVEWKDFDVIFLFMFF